MRGGDISEYHIVEAIVYNLSSCHSCDGQLDSVIIQTTTSTATATTTSTTRRAFPCP